MRKFGLTQDKKTLIIWPESIVDKNLRFDGKIVAGMNSYFWGNVECKNAFFAKGCSVNGVIKCRKAVLGAYMRFNRVEASGDVIIMDGCVGEYVKALGNVRIGNARVNTVEADGIVVIDGTARLGKLLAKKVIAVNINERF